MTRPPESWIQAIDDEDRTFIKRFILASGSLKEVARLYGISYPTVRLRLDRLIAKIETLEAFSQSTPFERTLRMCFADRRLDGATFKTLLQAYRQDQEESDD